MVEIPVKETTDALVHKSTALLPEFHFTESQRSKIMTHLNRPWMQSFCFEALRFSDTKLEQFHKLCRNYIASLDLGCPSAKHVMNVDNTDLSGLTEHQRYLVWVKGWKRIYRELSIVIRFFKQYRKTVHYPAMSQDLQAQVRMYNRDSNQIAPEILRNLSYCQLERLQETAQALLNARYNAKLASAERRRRSLASREALSA